MNLGEKLRYLRKTKGYSLKEVEENTGITQSYLSKIERGVKRNPSIETLQALARFFDVSIHWLVENSGIDSFSDKSKETKQKIIDMLELIDEKQLDLVYKIVAQFVNNSDDE